MPVYHGSPLLGTAVDPGVDLRTLRAVAGQDSH